MLDKVIETRVRIKELIVAADIKLKEQIEEVKRLRSIDAELEMCAYLYGKYQTLESVPVDTAEALVNDRTMLIDNFEEKYKPLIQDNVRLFRDQLNNMGKEILTREQIASHIDRYATDLKGCVAESKPEIVLEIEKADAIVRPVKQAVL